MDFESLFSVRPAGEKKVFEIYDGEKKAGFISIFEYEDSAYLLYFAVIPELRNKGLGTASLKKLCEEAGDKRIVLDIERVTEGQDSGIKSRRRYFYLRNGFKETGFYSHFYGVDYEYLVHGKAMDSQVFMSLIEALWGGNGLSFYLDKDVVKVNDKSVKRQNSEVN